MWRAMMIVAMVAGSAVAGDVPEEAVRATLAAGEAERLEWVERIETSLAAVERQAAAVKKARVNRSQHDYIQMSKAGQYTMRSRDDRDALAKELGARVESYRKLIAKMGEMEGKASPRLVAKVGMGGVVDDVRTIQVIDDDEMLVRYSGSTLWITGVPTAGIVDDKTITIGTALYVRGTRQYDTAGGGTNTVFDVVPLGADLALKWPGSIGDMYSMLVRTARRIPELPAPRGR